MESCILLWVLRDQFGVVDLNHLVDWDVNIYTCRIIFELEEVPKSCSYQVDINEIQALIYFPFNYFKDFNFLALLLF